MIVQHAPRGELPDRTAFSKNDARRGELLLVLTDGVDDEQDEDLAYIAGVFERREVEVVAHALRLADL